MGGAPSTGASTSTGSSSSIGGSVWVGGAASTGGQSTGVGGMELGGGGVGGDALAGASGTGGQEGTMGDIVAQGVRWVGRVDAGEASRFAWSGTGFVARFLGTGITVTLKNAEGYLFRVVVDGETQPTFSAQRGEKTYALVTGLPPVEHTVELYRQTEGRYGDSELQGVEIIDGELLEPRPGPGAVLEFIGDSITCGYGNLGADASCSFSFETESHWDSYGAVAGRALGVDVHTIALSGRGLTRNNDGTTAGTLPDMYQRTLARDATLVWSYTVPPKVIVVNLGTNDFAQGNPGLFFQEQYLNFLHTLRALHPQAFLLVTLGPMMRGSNLNAARTYLQNAVAAFEADGNAGKVGFLEYPAQDSHELGCDSHPNVVKHQSMAELLTETIAELDVYSSASRWAPPGVSIIRAPQGGPS